MRKRIFAVAAGAAFAALAGAVALLAWAFGTQGTIGLYRWEPYYRTIFRALGAGGVAPLAFAALAWALAARASGRAAAGDGGGAEAAGRQARPRRGAAIAAAASAIAAIALGAASAAVDAAFFAWISSTSSGWSAPLAEVADVDIRAGIPGRDGVARLSISSDPHWGSPKADAEARTAVLRSVAAAEPRRDAFLILGDNVERGMEEAPWREQAADLSSILGSLPVLSLMGNHDALVNGEGRFLKAFPSSLASGSSSPRYYSFDAGAARVVVLNLLWGAESFDAAQRAWLERTLAAVPAGRQAVVLSHCFVYASGYVVPETGMPWFDHFETIPEVAPILERGGVDLVVSGHNHYLELLERNGVTYALVGGMGGLLDPPPEHVSPASVWLGQGLNGRLDLDISESGIALAFRGRDGGLLREAFLPR